MKLIDLDDPFWEKLDSGYDDFDPRVREWVKTLMTNNFPESHWEFLWDELHHQNDVWESSYAVVPYLAKYAATYKKFSWQVFGFPVVVELARLDTDNPSMPPEIELSYFWAFKELARLAIELESWSEEQTPVISACIALAKGQRLFSRAYLELSSKDTAARFLQDEIGWEPSGSEY